MKKIEINLEQSVIAPLLDFIKPLVEEFGNDLVVKPDLPPDADADLREWWTENLMDTLANDAEALMHLFDRRFFESGTIEVNPENADSVLRASAAIRLRLRDRALKRFSDEDLEKGELNYYGMSQEEQRSYACYIFMATIQEVIIEHMDIIHGNR